MSKIIKVWQVVDDYTPDAGSTIYGTYATIELAQERLDNLCNPDNEYGENVGENCDIRSEVVKYE